MTHTDDKGNTWVIEEPSGRCEDCGEVAETRPYGPKGENVCFPCAMKDEDAAKRQFRRRLEGDHPADATQLNPPSEDK